LARAAVLSDRRPHSVLREMAGTVDLSVRGKRDSSPTRALWDSRGQTRERLAEMQQLGLHPIGPGWAASVHSGNFRECTLRLLDSNETMRIPVQVCTKVKDVREMIALRCVANPENITIVAKQGCTWLAQQDWQEIRSNVTVRGVRTFGGERVKREHATVIIGAGYNGIKAALLCAQKGQEDYVVFERNNRVGGSAWLKHANSTTRLSTEMSAFHVWFGPEFGIQNDKLGYPTNWETWPLRERVLEHFQYACERYGILPHIRLQTSVDIVAILDSVIKDGKKVSDKSYHLMLSSRADSKALPEIKASIVCRFPGACLEPRDIEFPNENQFGGKIVKGYGDAVPLDEMQGARAAILGGGGVAIENVQTCLEKGAQMVYLVARRKNLVSPCMCCWFVNQAPTPVPAEVLLDMFGPMYNATGFGDPRGYKQISKGPQDVSNCTIINKSRFAISDIFFLACAWGRCEYIEDTVTRCSQGSLHLKSMRKIDDLQHIIKAFGFTGDISADRLFKVTQMHGYWPDGDFTRIIYANPLGIDSSSFTSLSSGLSSYSYLQTVFFFADFPVEANRVWNLVSDTLPRKTQSESSGGPLHLLDVRHVQESAMILEAACPRLSALLANVGEYKHDLSKVVEPCEKIMTECRKNWDDYQEQWRMQGYEHEHMEYPYTRGEVTNWNGWLGTRGNQMEDSSSRDLFDPEVSKSWWLKNDFRGKELVH